MLKHRFFLTFRAVLLSSNTPCAACQYRAYRTSSRLLTSASPKSPLPPREPIPRPERNGVFKPQPLGRPIGFQDPPRPGANSGVDTRSWKQRREDLVDYDKHMERRAELARRLSTPYFRDFSNMRFHGGKSFLANNKMFKAEAALYFPNLQGITLEANETKDTTSVLEGKISVVNVFSSIWGENQIKTFTGGEQNPEVQRLLSQSNGLAQRVDINIEENAVKYGLIKLFKSDIRRKTPPPQYGKYFVVRKGVSDHIRESIGLLNTKVGYVFLLDENCKIRWAACGDAEDFERECLVRNLRKLIADARVKTPRTEDPVPVRKEPVDNVAAGAS